MTLASLLRKQVKVVISVIKTITTEESLGRISRSLVNSLVPSFLFANAHVLSGAALAAKRMRIQVKGHSSPVFHSSNPVHCLQTPA